VFPTPAILARRILGPRGGPDYSTDLGTNKIDCVAGMCLYFDARGAPSAQARCGSSLTASHRTDGPGHLQL